MRLNDLTQAEVRALFDYDPDTGRLTRRIKSAGRQQHEGGDEYLHVGIHGYEMRRHNVIFLWWHGYLPELVDHVNRDKTDNRIANLRAATRSQNNANVGLSRNNKSGFKGVSFHRPTAKWRATCKGKHLGLFSCRGDAAMVYNEAALELYGEFAVLNVHPLNYEEAV